MSEEFTIEFSIHEQRTRRGRRRIRQGEEQKTPELPSGRVPRISRLMALAIRCDELIRSGEVTDYADIARLGHLTRARISQIANLTLLAPDIQEQILHLPPTTSGRDPIAERDIRPIAVIPDWRKQRQAWQGTSVATANSTV